MEGDKNFQDLIRQYQVMLENEKRRLTPENFNLTQIDDINETEAIESCPSEQHQSQQIVKPNDSPDVSKNVVVNKKGIAYDIHKETKPDIHQKRAEMMEQWVTDSFYTSFPSFKKQDTNTLADDRREEYKKYLAEVSNKKLLDAVSGRTRKTQERTDSETAFSKPAEKHKISTRDKLLNDLKHSDLSYNNNLDAIQDRNQKIATEKTRRKFELQQELMRQIEEKRLGIEKLRAKEKEEDEILQRKLENQMKALQMNEELTRKNTQKVLASNPVKETIRSRDPIPRRDFENNIDAYMSGDGSPENRIKSDTNANNDRQIYKFFSNSAPHNVNYYNHPVGLNNMSIVDPQLHHISNIHNPTQHCSRCRRLVPMSCDSCCRNDFNPSYFRCYRCNLLQNMDVCDNCRRAFVQSWNHNGDLERGINISYQRDHRPQILEITYQDHASQAQLSTSPHKDYRNKATQSESPDSSRYSVNSKTQHDHHSPLTNSNKIVGMETTLSNVPEAVSLSKEHELLELKRKNDILIAKFARNYGSLRKRKPVLKEPNPQFSDDSFPLMREHLTTTSSRDLGKAQESSQAVRKLEYKWEIPVVQKQVVTNTPSVKVLTQIGAIAKQLQLEKLNFSDD